MTDSLVIDIPSWEIGRTGIYAESVLRGIKPIAELMIGKAQEVLVREELERLGVLWESAKVAETHVEFLLFAHEHLRDVARRELGLPYNEDVFAHWIRGKMFGYAENQIAEYCAEQKEHFNREKST